MIHPKLASKTNEDLNNDLTRGIVETLYREKKDAKMKLIKMTATDIKGEKIHNYQHYKLAKINKYNLCLNLDPTLNCIELYCIFNSFQHFRLTCNANR